MLNSAHCRFCLRCCFTVCVCVVGVVFFQLDASTGKYEDAPIGLGWQGPSLAYRKLEKLEKDPRFCAWLSRLFRRYSPYSPPTTASSSAAQAASETAWKGLRRYPERPSGWSVCMVKAGGKRSRLPPRA